MHIRQVELQNAEGWHLMTWGPSTLKLNDTFLNMKVINAYDVMRACVKCKRAISSSTIKCLCDE